MNRTVKVLAEMGLNLKDAKTRITHTLNQHEGNVGFDFLGFTIRQFKTGKHRSRLGFRTLIKPRKDGQKRHLATMADVIKEHRGAPPTALIAKLNRKIRGWSNDYRTGSFQRVFPRMDYQLHWKLRKWAKWRHPRKSHTWRYQRYWKRRRVRLDFCDGTTTLVKYEETKQRPHVKVIGDQSPFDGDWLYWALRLGRDPTKPQRVVVLLRKQHGKCHQCNLRFRAEDIMAVHHIDHDRKNNVLPNLALRHAHCHDEVHR